MFPRVTDAALVGYDIAMLGVPGSWPVASVAPVRAFLHWTTPQVGLLSGGDWWTEERPTGLTVGWYEEAEYRVEMEPEPHVEVTLGPASEEYAALSFVLAVLPLALPLFGLEPLHGVALALDGDRAMMLMGGSESGKSTTAASLRSMGLRFLADDACAIDAEGMLWPGPPLLTTRTPAPGDQVLATYDGKSVLAIDAHPSQPHTPVAAIVLRPEQGARLALQPLSGAEALSAVLGQVRAPWALPQRRQRLQLAIASRVAAGPVAVVTFDHARHAPVSVAELILSWVSAVGYGAAVQPRATR